MITDEQYNEAYAALAAYEEEIHKHNEALIKSFGENAENDFYDMCEDCKVTDKIELVSEQHGRDQDESYGIFKNVFVDQMSVGDSGDNYAGSIYANANGQWIRIPYEC